MLEDSSQWKVIEFQRAFQGCFFSSAGDKAADMFGGGDHWVAQADAIWRRLGTRHGNIRLGGKLNVLAGIQ